MRSRSLSLAQLFVLGFALAGFVAPPLFAQTGSTWHDQKLNDMRSHERSKLAGTEAGREYDLAVGYLHRMQSLLDDEDRGERQEKKLQKSYEKAVAHLEKAIEAADDWLDPRMMLGAAHYKMKEYRAAKDAYEGALALDPENESAKSYLASVNWYLVRSGAASEPGGSS
jgi:tetratricopeptide (TPR) repeat protein